MNNFAHLSGNMTADAVLRTTKTGKKVVSFTIGVSRGKDKDTDFFNVVAWDYLADRMANAKKGQLVVVDGRLANRQYQDKNGNNRTVTEVVANDLWLAMKTVHAQTQQGGSQPAQQPAAPAQNPTSQPASGPDNFETVEDTGDLPF